jgi:uncharacterized UPF0160 family protein
MSSYLLQTREIIVFLPRINFKLLMNYQSIITHAGAFHTDEVLAIATIFHFYKELPIKRTFKITDEEFENDSILVLDIGRRFESSKGNFDHHQDATLPATNILILDHFCKDDEIKNYLKKQLFSYVSAVDVGQILEKENDRGFSTPTIRSLIKNMNNFKDGFDAALEMAQNILTAFIITAEKTIESKTMWHSLEFEKGIAIQHTTDFITGWKELALKKKILLLVSPNTRGGYQIVSRDSEIIQIPNNPKQTFRHNSGFLAVYPDFQTAITDARLIISSL